MHRREGALDVARVELGAFERLPPGTGLRAMFRLSDTVDYHDGEQPPD